MKQPFLVGLSKANNAWLINVDRILGIAGTDPGATAAG